MREPLRSRLSVARWISLNELHRMYADKSVIFFGLVMPVAIILLVGSTFGGVTRIPIGVLDADRTGSSSAYLQALDRADQVEIDVYSSERNLRRDVRTGALYLGLVLPGGFELDLDAGAAAVPLLVDPSSNEVGSALATVRAVTDAFSADRAAIGFVAEQLEGDVAEAEDAVVAAKDAIEPVRALELDDTDRREETPSAFAYPAPANMVLFVFINTFAISTGLATDRKNGIVRRILATPHRSGTVLLGIGAARATFALVQSALILVVGRVVFDVDWGDPVVVAALVLVWAALATAVGILVGSVVGNSEQAQAIGIPIGVGMGMLGGCMWPLDIVPDALRVVGHITPHAWVMDAWENQVFGGDPRFSDAVGPLLVLLAFTIVIGGLAARALRRVVVR